jgi:hypothetical protein
VKRSILLAVAVGTLLSTGLTVGACGSATPDAETANGRQRSEMSDDGDGSGPLGTKEEGEVEPAAHDIEVPPAP